MSDAQRAKRIQRAAAISGWPMFESNAPGDALRKWVQHGDMSGVGEPHYSLILAWEQKHGVVDVKPVDMPLPPVEGCREWIGEPEFDRCKERAVGILWGKLFPPEALGPRCDRHVGWHCNGLSMDETIRRGYAIYDLRPTNAMHDAS